jgi:hypothetical protein
MSSKLTTGHAGQMLDSSQLVGHDFQMYKVSLEVRMALCNLLCCRVLSGWFVSFAEAHANAPNYSIHP